MTTVCIHQPDFAPWLGFFHRLLHCDLFVVLDCVQFTRRGWHHRDKIRTAQGAQWLTVPVIKKSHYHQTIADVRIDNSRPWPAQHIGTLRSAYGQAPYFKDLFPDVEALYAKDWESLLDLNMAMIGLLSTALDVEVETVFASELDVAGSKNALLLDILDKVGADTYLSGAGARAYLDEGCFRDAGVRVVWQDFKPPVYSQRWEPFIPMLSSLDALFNCGAEVASLIRA